MEANRPTANTDDIAWANAAVGELKVRESE